MQLRSTGTGGSMAVTIAPYFVDTVCHDPADAVPCAARISLGLSVEMMWFGAPVRILIIAVACIVVAPAWGDDSPRPLVEAFQGELLATMKEAESTTFADRYRRLEPVITATFHLPLMIRIAAGDAWDSATEREKYDLVAGFRRMSVSSVATLFGGYSGQQFETVGLRPGQQGTTLVDTTLTNPGGRRVALTYVAKRFEGSWRLIEVVVDGGISELTVRRSEYRRVLATDGVAGLIAVLNEKADELAAETSEKENKP